MQLDDAVLDMPFDFFLSFHFDHTQFQKYIESVKSNMVQIQAKLGVCLQLPNIMNIVKVKEKRKKILH